MKKFFLNLFEQPIQTEIFFGENLFQHEALQRFLDGKKAVIIADEVLSKEAKALQKLLKGDLFLVSFHEKIKTREAKQKIEDTLFQKGIGKDSLFISMGGGGLTDLVGFIAATYMRGISLIHFPTTLLGMVDAAFGGKTGVDTPFGKNLIGAFYHPLSIFIDLCFLKTLPEKEWLNGLAEILKMGLIYFPSLIFDVETHPLNWKEPPLLEKLIQNCIQTNIEVLEKDVKDKSLRKILNFGHTIGHGLEQVSDYEISHGEAVALGTLIESYFSMKLHFLKESEFKRILQLYKAVGFSFKLPLKFEEKAFIEALQKDKKNEKGKIHFVLLEKIGKAASFKGAYTTSISPKDLLLWMKEFLEMYG